MLICNSDCYLGGMSKGRLRKVALEIKRNVLVDWIVGWVETGV